MIRDDDYRREIRSFVRDMIVASVPLFVAWGIEEAKARIAKAREKRDHGS